MAHRLAASSLSAVVPGQMGRPGADRATTVFFNGLGRYKVFRIPALCRTANALLAFAEARPTVDDHGKIDLVLRRSTDGGRTWSDLVVVARGDETGESIGNPVPISLGGGGKFGFGEIVLLYCSNAAHLTEDAIRGGATAGGGRRVWLRRSFDAGLNWTQPVELTSHVKRPGWTWYATGPGGAIVLRNGTIVVPATHADGVGLLASGRDHSHVLLSHDSGATWTLGGDGVTHTNEATVAELPDGSVLLNARNLSPARRRVLQRSNDGGLHWSQPWMTEELSESPPRGCHGSMVGDAGGRIFFAAPSSPTARAQLTLRRSDDGGKTWPRQMLLHNGPSAYSSMRLSPNGRAIHILYERGETPSAFFAAKVVFERIRLDSADTPIGDGAPVETSSPNPS